MKETKVESGLEKKTNVTRPVSSAARKTGVASAIPAIVIGIGMIVAAIVLSNTFVGNTHVNDPTNVITVDSTYPSAEMYVGENFTFYVNWTASHDVQNVVLWGEIVKPVASLNDTSVRFTWIVGGVFEDAVLTDIGDRFTVRSSTVTTLAGVTVSYQVQMCYYASGDWSVHFYADGSVV